MPRPKGAHKRKFELIACEAWYDAAGNVLQFDHGIVAVREIDPDESPLSAQRSFDEFIEEEAGWAYHLNNVEDGDREDGPSEGEF